MFFFVCLLLFKKGCRVDISINQSWYTGKTLNSVNWRFIVVAVGISNEKLEELEERINKLEEERDNLEVQLETAKKENENEVEKLSKENDSLNDTNASLEEKIAELNSENEELKAELSEARDSVPMSPPASPGLAVEGEDVSVRKFFFLRVYWWL